MKSTNSTSFHPTEKFCCQSSVKLTDDNETHETNKVLNYNSQGRLKIVLAIASRKFMIRKIEET